MMPGEEMRAGDITGAAAGGRAEAEQGRQAEVVVGNGDKILIF